MGSTINTPSWSSGLLGSDQLGFTRLRSRVASLDASNGGDAAVTSNRFPLLPSQTLIHVWISRELRVKLKLTDGGDQWAGSDDISWISLSLWASSKIWDSRVSWLQSRLNVVTEWRNVSSNRYQQLEECESTFVVFIPLQFIVGLQVLGFSLPNFGTIRLVPGKWSQAGSLASFLSAFTSLFALPDRYELNVYRAMHGYFIITPLAFRLVPYNPRYHSAIRHETSWENETRLAA